MVAVVGGPAQRQLGEVAGADNEAAGAVGSVHQLEGAHTSLSVLEGDVQHALVLADVGKVAVDRVGDVDLGEGNMQYSVQNRQTTEAFSLFMRMITGSSTVRR